MTEMKEIKATLADINKKLDRVILQNKIAMNMAYGLPVKRPINTPKLNKENN